MAKATEPTLGDLKDLLDSIEKTAGIYNTDTSTIAQAMSIIEARKTNDILENIEAELSNISLYIF